MDQKANPKNSTDFYVMYFPYYFKAIVSRFQYDQAPCIVIFGTGSVVTAHGLGGQDKFLFYVMPVSDIAVCLLCSTPSWKSRWVFQTPQVL